jgi:hypothetical protein
MSPLSKGSIKMGGEFEGGQNMDILIEEDVLPFNSSKPRRITVSFVPKSNATTILSSLSITYNVTIANSTTTLYSNQFEDSDGILDLELVPSSASNHTQHFVTWGPDLTD